jgi:S-ribosylhomocysteine lyase LuxS involved in autoinducer biosynthesis
MAEIQTAQLVVKVSHIKFEENTSNSLGTNTRSQTDIHYLHITHRTLKNENKVEEQAIHTLESQLATFVLAPLCEP